VRNTLGAVDQRRSGEQAAVLYAKQAGADYTVLRIGDLTPPNPPPSSAGDVTVASGDVLDGATSPAVAAAALAQVVARQNPVARNVSLGVQGTGGRSWGGLGLPLRASCGGGGGGGGNSVAVH
jgi:hypothetical protein